MYKPYQLQVDRTYLTKYKRSTNTTSSITISNTNDYYLIDPSNEKWHSWIQLFRECIQSSFLLFHNSAHLSAALLFCFLKSGSQLSNKGAYCMYLLWLTASVQHLNFDSLLNRCIHKTCCRVIFKLFLLEKRYFVEPMSFGSRRTVVWSKQSKELKSHP